MAREHQVLVIAKNTAGIGARILALFNRRGFNVTKMTSGVTNTPLRPMIASWTKSKSKFISSLMLLRLKYLKIMM